MCSTMGLLSEDMNCCVCLEPYSRREKIPRVLHCEHTFCGPCLEAISRLQSGLLTVCCPLCRWITCSRASLPLAGSLFVNTEIWDQIADRQEEEEEMEVMSPWSRIGSSSWVPKVFLFLVFILKCYTIYCEQSLYCIYFNKTKWDLFILSLLFFFYKNKYVTFI
uniref:RING-type domain-containing protein n=1 Tax=Hucho hucho TaxID=62062 RepID=A0A4W5JXG4_9TELE